jgi:hypothetical protein
MFTLLARNRCSLAQNRANRIKNAGEAKENEVPPANTYATVEGIIGGTK